MSRFYWDLGVILRTEAHRRVVWLFVTTTQDFEHSVHRQVSLCHLMPRTCMKQTGPVPCQNVCVWTILLLVKRRILSICR
jgi:hypothetical protein